MGLFSEISRKEQVILMRSIKPSFPAAALLFEAAACNLFNQRLECPNFSSTRSSWGLPCLRSVENICPMALFFSINYALFCSVFFLETGHFTINIHLLYSCNPLCFKYCQLSVLCIALLILCSFLKKKEKLNIFMHLGTVKELLNILEICLWPLLGGVTTLIPSLSLSVHPPHTKPVLWWLTSIVLVRK